MNHSSKHVTCPCQVCSGQIEFEPSQTGTSVTCPHCGIETILFDPIKNLTQPKESKPTPNRSKIPTVVWIGTGVFVLCALCLTTFLIGKNSQKRSDQTSEVKPEAVESKPKSNLPQFLQNLKDKQRAVKKVAFPPPPTNGIEFTAKLLENFPERVAEQGKLEGKFGWMNADFFQISNSEIEGNNRLDSSVQVGFGVFDKNGDVFDLCYAEKSKLADFLLSLKDGDRIRIFGQAMMILRPGTDATFDAWLHVDSIQVIK